MKSSGPEALWAVVLAGGVGSRFWPVSTPTRPKQLLALAGDQPLIRDAVERIAALVPATRTRILTGASLAAPLLAALPGLGRNHLLIEPQAKGTAPVLAWAAFEIARTDPDAIMISLHADHAIQPASAFLALLADVAAVSFREQKLFTIGAVPDRPETGYGYIRPGVAITREPATNAVDRFVEKPTRDVAETYVREGYLWNTGIFVWPVRLLIEEMERHTPEIANCFPLLAAGRIGDYFERVPKLTIDVGLLERSDRVAVARATFAWDDVGGWDAVGRMQPADASGNVTVGESHAIDSEDCILWSDDGAVVVFGARGLLVVRSGGVTMVAPRERAADLKSLLAALPAHVAALGGGNA
ncbi:MAG: mannose-1-phosphate guanylyltransferase [Longimicrobiales bacterium]